MQSEQDGSISVKARTLMPVSVPVTDPVREALLIEIIDKASQELPDPRTYPGTKFSKLGIEVNAPELGNNVVVAVRFKHNRGVNPYRWEWCNDNNKGIKIVQGDPEVLSFKESTFTVMPMAKLNRDQLVSLAEELGAEVDPDATDKELLELVKKGIKKDDVIVWNRTVDK